MWLDAHMSVITLYWQVPVSVIACLLPHLIGMVVAVDTFFVRTTPYLLHSFRKNS
jgi:hypothetical protein